MYHNCRPQPANIGAIAANRKSKGIHARTREQTMKSLVTALVVGCALAASGMAAEAASLVSGKKLEVNVNPDTLEQERLAVWERFGPWCAIQDWHPAVKKCEESKEGDVTYRTLTLQDGGVIKEKLTEQKPGMSYKYVIVESPLPVKNYEAQLSVVPDDDDLDEINVVWAATYDPADGKDAKEARNTIDGIFKDGIKNIEKMIGKKEGAKGDKD
jgi:hypothetical protein